MGCQNYLIIISLLLNFISASKYGNRTLDEWTWLTAHNSHVNWKDSKILEAFTNQYYGINKQLEFGVRGFMLDIDSKSCSDFEKIFGICKCTGICLCHGPCSDLVKDGFYIKKFDYALSAFVSFLNLNPEEIITIFLEDYIKEVITLQRAFASVKGFSELVFNPYSTVWNVTEKGWPKMADMVKANKRILIVDDEKRGFHARKWPGIIRSRDFFIENHYEWVHDIYEWKNFNSTSLLGDSQDDIIVNNTAYVGMSSCFSLHKDSYGPLWNVNRPLTLSGREHKGQVVNINKLFLFNHFVGVKALTKSLNPITQILLNKNEFILKRLEEKCYVGTNFKKPNYIALDFIDETHYKEIIEPMNSM